MSIPNSLGVQAFNLAGASGNSSNFAIPVGEHEVTVYVGTNATAGGGTYVLQTSFDGGTTWYAVPNASWTTVTANTQLGRVTLMSGGLVRASFSGATSATVDLKVKFETVRLGNLLNFAITTAGVYSSTFTVNDLVAGTSLPVTTTSLNAQIAAWAVQGTWGGATAALQVSPDGGTSWYNLAAGITANGFAQTANLTDVLLRFALTTVGSGAALTGYFIN